MALGSCLRQAYRSARPQLGINQCRCAAYIPRSAISSPTWPASRELWARASSNSAGHAFQQNRFTDRDTSDDRTTPFKAQREKTLQLDRQSDEPLYSETYPRIEPSSIHRKSVSEFLNDFHDTLSDEQVIVSGRIRSKRVMGSSLIFLHIVNEFKSLQIMISKARVVDDKKFKAHKFSMFRNLIQVGDHICEFICSLVSSRHAAYHVVTAVTGVSTRTKTGELTLAASELPELLSPTMEQIPERLEDPKARMADRHLDLLANREAADVLRLRSHIIKYMRDHFHSKRFLEFQTPILAENAGGAVARPFVTKATEFREKDLSLRVAPELWLKRLVVGGMDKVFEIGPSFRNEGLDATHNPEFTTCEFYSAYSNLVDLINETEELICGLAQHCQGLIATELQSLTPLHANQFVRPFKQVEFIPALEKALGARLPKLSSEDALPEVLAMLKLSGIAVPGEVPETLPKLLDRLAALYLEPMSFKEPIFITHHPACMSPLSKSFVCPKTLQLVSARAELFMSGRELANMYEEENDPEEQKRKLMAHRHLVNKPGGGIAIEMPTGLENDEAAADRDDELLAEIPRQSYWTDDLDTDGETSPLDQSFVEALQYGLPPTGGWGCGVDRLAMLFSGATRISQVLSFGNLKHVVGQSNKAKSAPKVGDEGGDTD
jgi:lysyl-tRNA synthetase, class II